jgi:hypothetical protein
MAGHIHDAKAGGLQTGVNAKDAHELFNILAL